MFGGIFNLIVGLIFIGGGLSGQLALRGTNSGPLLALLGLALAAFGIFQLVRSRR